VHCGTKPRTQKKKEKKSRRLNVQFLFPFFPFFFAGLVVVPFLGFSKMSQALKKIKREKEAES